MKCCKLTKDSPVTEILVISLSNIGDVVLTAPVIDVLLDSFPQARITVVVGPKAGSLFSGQPRIRTIVFEKHQTFRYNAAWYRDLNANKFDVIVDLRQTLLPVLLSHHWRTPLLPSRANGHMLQKHLGRLSAVFPGAKLDAPRCAIVVSSLTLPFEGFIVIAPGAADQAKRWPIARYQQLLNALVQQGRKIILVGDGSDARLIKEHLVFAPKDVVSLAGQTDLRTLGFVLLRAGFLIAHDSGIMHLANYLGVPQVILWGPTDKAKYGPWGAANIVVHKGRDMTQISVEDVLDAVKQVR